MRFLRLLLCPFLFVACDETPSAPEPTAASPDAAAVPAAPAPAPAPALPAWRFLSVEGEVLLDGAPAAKDQQIGETSTIEVKAKGLALVTFGPKSIVEVREKTKLTLGSSPRKKLSVKLLAGSLWSFFDGETDYEVEAQNAVAGVRGTVFYVNAEDPKRTVVCACSHAVHLESLDPKKPTHDDVVAKEWEHLGVAFTRKGKRVTTKKLGGYRNPPNHPDARGEELLGLMPR
jgi:hypothetical protein